jgi:hypothetical protein
MLFLQILCVQDIKKMFAIHKIIIHKIIHRNVCYIAFFFEKKKKKGRTIHEIRSTLWTWSPKS